jgi:hypothetical protein
MALRYYGAFMGQVLMRKPIDEALRADASSRRIAFIQLDRPTDVREFLMGNRPPSVPPP